MKIIISENRAKTFFFHNFQLRLEILICFFCTFPGFSFIFIPANGFLLMFKVVK